MEANATLKKIIAEAKRVRKAHPKKFAKWTDYVKYASTKIKPAKKVAAKKVSGWKKGTTRMIEVKEKPFPKKKNVRVFRNHKKDLFAKPGTFNKFKTLAGLFDTSILHDIDELKKQYRNLALKYHPDSGGTHEQFIQLKNEYDALFKKLLNGSKLNEEQKANEIKIDEALQAALDAIITLPNINIEIIGKWIWVSGETYPLRTALKSAGFFFIKKGNVPYWIYKGAESAGRGKMEMDEIRAKHGSKEVMKKPQHKITGIGTLSTANKRKFAVAIKKLAKAINKRPV
jgi:hypothetical protein